MSGLAVVPLGPRVPESSREADISESILARTYRPQNVEALYRLALSFQGCDT